MPQHYLADFGGERAEPLLKPATEVSHRAKTTVNRNATKGSRPISMPARAAALPFNFEARRELNEDLLVESILPASGLDCLVEWFSRRSGNS